MQMDYSNFSFIKSYQPSLYEFGMRAESYAFSDPQSAIVKLRCFAEAFVGYIYRELRLPTYGAKKLVEKIENAAFVEVVEDCVIDKLTLIRLKGNKAAHLHGVTTADALEVNKEAWFLAAWVFMTFHGGKVSDLPNYVAPKPVDENLPTKAKELETELQSTTEALEKALEELSVIEQEQTKALAEIEVLNEQVNQPKLEQIKASGQEAVRLFDFESSATRMKISLEDMYAEYELTQGQTELVQQLDEFLNSRTDNVFLLRGYAGTGKTFITKGLTEYFKALRRNYVLSAPTGKAAKVIASKTQSPAFTIHKTIYSFKDISEFSVDGLEGTETYKLYAKLAVNELSADTVYIVDESSMISDVYNESEFFRCGSGHLLKDFLEFVNLDHNDHGKKIIFIGDDAQLPPVDMPFSPALDSQYLVKEYGLKTREYELTEVVRQKSGSGVMANAISIRKALKAKVFNQLDIDLSLPDVVHVEHADLISRYLQSCDGKINTKSIVIAHSNADVAAYNRRIREEFFPDRSEVCVKDKLMVVNNSDYFGFFISNGDFGQVLQIYGEPELRHVPIRRKNKETGDLEELTVPLQFRDVCVRFRDIDGDIREFDAKIIETLLYSDDKALSSDQNKAVYIDFCIRYPGLKRKSLEFKETLRADPYFNALRVKFGYAITCHKAQGSEWENVFVKCKTHQNQMCADYFRWLYTAITRTSMQLFLLDEPHIRMGTGAKIISSPGMDFAPINTAQKTLEAIPENTPEYSSVPNDLPVETNFGIPDSNIFLNGLLKLVKQAISASGIEISDIEHHQYNEGYHLVRGAESGRINITYNNQCKLTSINAATDNPMTSEAQQLLSAIVGRVIANTEADNSRQWTFNDEFLDELHQGIESTLTGTGISVSGVKEQNFSQRYTFQSASEIAVIDVYYNKKKQITNYSPLKNMSSSNELLGQTLNLLSQGLGNG
tara:strand:- start:28287 stop:31136 length:2850 start_codon:yes stop_codon:yes gene_type:complete